ncbi:MAG: HdeD family acid-resistance protein [Pirellulales bacterium]|nr:HdeD family acid-resistance protein [Pirellulales bacterium]
MNSESQSQMSSGSNQAQGTLEQSWGWFMALGIGLIVLGALAIVFSGLATFGATLILGWALLIGGIFQGVHAFFVRNWGGFFMQALAACLYVVVGILVLANPVGAMFMLTLLLAVFFLFEGIVKLFLAFQVRPTQNWGWIAFSGALSLVLSAIIWMGWPADSLWVVGLLLGINILFGGWATVMFTLGARGLTCGWLGGNKRNVTPSI